MTVLGQMLMEDGIKKGRMQGVQALVETCREFELSRQDTKAKIAEKFSLASEDAEMLMKKYWK